MFSDSLDAFERSLISLPLWLKKQMLSEVAAIYSHIQEMEPWLKTRFCLNKVVRVPEVWHEDVYHLILPKIYAY